MPKILVVGSLNLDLTLYGANKIPEPGELISCSSYAYAPGGKGANQAAALVKLGAEAPLVGCVGSDRNGKLLQAALESHGVRTDYLRTDGSAQTGLAVICTDSTGQSRLYGIPGANMALDAADIPAILNTEKPDMVLMQLEMPMQTAIDTYRMAKAQGIPVFLDAGPAQKVPLKEFQGILVISPNEAETCAMTGIRVTDEASALRAAWEIYQRALPQYVLLKLGARGALLYDGKTGRRFPARKVRAVDTTAAGDTFNAAVCFRLCQGDSLERSIAFANAAAAITVSRQGALTSIPTEAEVTALISGTDNG